MFGWLGFNSRGTVTTGIGWRFGSGGQRSDDGCIGQGMSCLGALVALLAILAMIWLGVDFVRGVLRG